MTITPTRVFVIAGMLTMSLLVTFKVVASKPPPLQPPPPAAPALIELYLGTPPSGTGPGASCGYVLTVEQWAFYHRPHVHVILVEKEIPYELTWTCYEPQIEGEYYVPCKKCQACVERENAGAKNNLTDINNYRIRK